jgi:hypothetical protein
MSVDLKALSEEDRQDFERRLANYGLDTSVVQEGITVQPSSRLILAHGPGRDTFIKPVVLEVNEFDKLTRMIGVDDRIFQRMPQKGPLPRRIDLPLGEGAQRRVAGPGLAVAAMPQPEAIPPSIDFEKLTSADLDNIRIAARAYLRGNSALVASFKSILETIIGIVIVPVWPVLFVKVSSGSTLEFGPGVNVLVAYDIEIEDGGKIVSHGHLTVSCTKLRKVLRRVVIKPHTGVLAKKTIFR